MRVLTISTSSQRGPSPAIQSHLDVLADAYDIQFVHTLIEAGQRRSYWNAIKRVQKSMFHRPRYDLVHAFYGHCGLVARLQFTSPVVVTFQGSDLLGGMNNRMHKRDGVIGRIVARLVEGVIVMSPEMKLASKRDDAFVIPFGIDTDIFHPRSRTGERERLGLPRDEMIVLFPWHPDRIEKNFSIAETAVAKLNQSGLKVRLLPMYARSASDLAAYMNACDALVMVSDHEGSPVAIREALACNLPVVAADVGDVAQILAGVGNCYIVRRTPEDVADKLARVFRSNERTNGSDAVSHYDVRQAASQLFAVYRNIAAKRRFAIRG